MGECQAAYRVLTLAATCYDPQRGLSAERNSELLGDASLFQNSIGGMAG